MNTLIDELRRRVEHAEKQRESNVLLGLPGCRKLLDQLEEALKVVDWRDRAPEDWEVAAHPGPWFTRANDGDGNVSWPCLTRDPRMHFGGTRRECRPATDEGRSAPWPVREDPTK